MKTEGCDNSTKATSLEVVSQDYNVLTADALIAHESATTQTQVTSYNIATSPGTSSDTVTVLKRAEETIYEEVKQIRLREHELEAMNNHNRLVNRLESERDREMVQRLIVSERRNIEDTIRNRELEIEKETQRALQNQSANTTEYVQRINQEFAVEKDRLRNEAEQYVQGLINSEKNKLRTEAEQHVQGLREQHKRELEKLEQEMSVNRESIINHARLEIDAERRNTSATDREANRKLEFIKIGRAHV